MKKYAWIMEAISKANFSTRARAMKLFLMEKKKYVLRNREADIDSIIKCALCPNMCKFDCPVLEVEKNEAVSPSGKMRIAYFIETERISSEDAIDLMYKCTGCDACRQWCPFDFSVGDILRGVRADIISMDMVPPEVLKIKEDLEREHVVGKRSIKENIKRNIKIDSHGKGLLYFVGCSVASERNEIAEAMLKIFDYAGEEYCTIEEWCCGFPLYNLGFIDIFKKFAEHNLKEIRESGCKTVVCSCPTCAYMLKQIYPEMGYKLKVNILHSSEYIFTLIKEGKIKTCYEEECVYHDPCTLARKLRIEDEPREVLKIAGAELKESDFSRKYTKCCGMGGQLSRTNAEIADRMAKMRAEELLSVANCIITACPSCKTAFEKHGRVYELSEVVALGLK